MTERSGEGHGASREDGSPSPDSRTGDGFDDQFRALVNAVEEYAIFRLDADGYVESWNPGAERIKGYATDEILGEHFSRFYTDGDREAGRPERNLADAAEYGSVTDEGWRLRADGSQFWANVTITVLRDDDGNLEGFAKVTRDMTEQRRAREAQQHRLSVSQSVAEAESFEAGLQAAIEDVCEWTDWVVGLAWVPTGDGTVVRLPVSYVDTPEFEPFEVASREFSFGPGEGIPGRVLESGEPVWFSDVTSVSASVYPRTEKAAAVGLQTGVGIPVVADGEVAVVLEFYLAEEREIDDHFFELVTSITADLGGLVARKRVEDELNQERELLEEMMKAAPVGISVLMPDGETTRMNEQARALRGISADAPRLDADDRVFYDDAGDEIPFDERPFSRVRTSKRPVYDWTGEIELPGGRRKWLSIDAAPILDDDGTLARVVIVEEDITELQEQYRAITESINDVIITIDENSVVRSVNPAVVEVFGYEQAELTGESLTTLMPDGYPERHNVAIDRYLETRERTLDWDYVELPGQHVDGSTVPLAVSFSEFRYRGERFFCGVIRDISDRKTHERQLETRARQQQAVADLGQFALEANDLDELMHEAASTVAAVLDTDYCKVLDLDVERDELRLRQGVGWDEGIVGEATMSAVEADSQAAYTLENEHPIVVSDLEAEPRFGGPDLLRDHDVHSGISTVIGPFDEPWGILGTHDTEHRAFTEEDVTFVQSVANILAEAIERHRYQTELQRTVAELKESNERLEQFAYAASHDLQEPLRMVSSYLQLVEQRYADELDDDGEEFLEFAVDGADRMKSMIDGLLAYSRVESRGDPFESVELDAVLDDVRQDLEVKVAEHDADVQVESLPRVYGDAGQLHQVFQNLLSNAIKYSGDEPPHVRVRAERDGDSWVVLVSDDGIGIDPTDADRIFEVFQSLHSQSEYSGTGIGLALCKRIVERHGGDIWVESEPGEGATFAFTLPAIDSHET